MTRYHGKEIIRSSNILIVILLFCIISCNNASTYRFLSEFTSSSSVLVPIANSTNTTTMVTTTTIGFVSLSYIYEFDTTTWQILMDNDLPAFTNTSQSISLRYFRLIHKNLLSTGYAKQLFLPSIGNLTDVLQQNSTLLGSNNLAIDVQKMYYSFNGTTKGSILNETNSKLDIPEMFASTYSVQLFSLSLNMSGIQDNSTEGTIPIDGKQLVNLTLFKGRNPTYSYSLLESLRSSLKVLSVTTANLKNLCSSASPTIAFAWNSWKLWFTLAVVVLMLMALILGWWRAYFVIFFASVVLAISGVITIKDALAGFSNDGGLTVALLYPVVQPLSENILFLKGAKMIFGSPKYGLWLCILRICIAISTFSAFINNTPIVVTATPLIKDWARQHNISASKILIPMCYITTAGGLLTLIGTSSNIVTSSLYVSYGYTAFTFYEFFYIGSILVVITTIYLMTYGVWVLPNRKGGMFRLARERGEQFLSKLTVDDPLSPLIGKNKHKVVSYLGLKKIEVIEVIRKKPLHTQQSSSSLSTGSTRASDSTKIITETSTSSPEETVEHILPVPDTLTVELNDVIIFKGTPDSILQLHSITGVTQRIDKKKQLTSIIHVMLGTETLQMNANKTAPVSDVSTPEVELVENPSSETNLGNLEEERKEIVIDIYSDSDSNADLIIHENKISSEASLSTAPPIPKAAFQSKIDHQNLHKQTLKRRASISLDSPTISELGIRRTKSLEHLHAITSTATTGHLSTNSLNVQPKVVPTADNSPTPTTKKEKQDVQKIESENEPEFFEVVVSKYNPCSGSKYSEFERRYGVVVLAVRHNKMLGTNTDLTDFKSVTVSSGDTLLLIGKSDFYTKYQESKDFYLISRCNVDPNETSSNQKFIVKIPFTKKEYNLWWWKHLIFPIFIAMIAGAIAGYAMINCVMIAFCVIIVLRLIPPIKAVESIDWPLIILIGSSFGVGTAITQSGLGEAVAEILKLMQIPPYLLPAFITLVSLVVTSVITNNAAVAICFPIGMAVAHANNLNPRCFAIVCAVACSSVFATPIGYQCNMMIQGPGGYSFMDYVKAGLPLTILYFFAISIFVPLIWGLYTPNF